MAKIRCLMGVDSTTLMDVLPGVRLEVGEVTSTLATMWQVESREAVNFRASQLNLILHFGMKTSPQEAEIRFQTAIRFAQRYPCRIIVLCPRLSEKSAERPVLEAKLYSQCFVGVSMREKCCCEALMLSYATSEFLHLRNQVSVWLEADLPVFHWFHRVPRERIEAQYMDFIHSFQRVIYDNAVEENAYDGMEWPRPERVIDLAEARLLPLKQTLGPFLAGYPPEVLLDGLEQVEFQIHPSFLAEGKHLMSWMKISLDACGAIHDGSREKSIALTHRETEADAAFLLKLSWITCGEKSMTWILGPDGCITLKSSLGGVSVERNQMLEWMPEEMALSEAIFF